jgi:hypothetical protein
MVIASLSFISLSSYSKSILSDRITCALAFYKGLTDEYSVQSRKGLYVKIG